MNTKTENKTSTASERDLTSLSVPNSVLSRIPYRLAVEYFVFPTGIDPKGRIEALMAYPDDIDTLQKIQLHTGVPVKPSPVKRDELLQLIQKHYPEKERKGKTFAGGADSRGQGGFDLSGSNIVVVDDIIHEAVRLRASDIHFEPFEGQLSLRFRIDGVLQEMTSIPKEKQLSITSRLKIMSGMDIAEKRRPQDGKIRLQKNGMDVDIRVSTLPTDFGEKVVMRLLDKSSFNFNLDTIGMDQKRLSLFKRAVQKPNGIILLTGPTGSGKSTTLYSILNYLKKPGVNISTVEEPVEYNIPGVNQTQVNRSAGVTFALALRTLLRQDPDIIMVGEMRDTETAQIAIRASLTGHLVLSTLHTNDAPSAGTRLVDMGLEPYLISSSVTMIVAQRLVRKICTHCKCEENISDDIKKNLGLPLNTRVYKGLGCSECGNTGYKGRTGIYEVLTMNESIRKLINEKSSSSQIRDMAAAAGMTTLRDNAVRLLREGTTSIEEVVREISFIS